ncbi:MULTISPECIES: hypothetical protein [unclassified Lactococcus]|uniref:hypothetical protein n=1 Tax=unclassified Lactococcus TaxID=2643510 RepID=UPI0011CBC545|nr:MULTISPECIES: hypothetical protein [unclassified Lactococcus]MQW24021.1 hypothetical protein [Lactococcus sp. dk101]TXK36610.1 hypothetical protein FVP42_11060 [Lactococcus sp. dk310]TXK46922.1 hypothetical protein FVP43_10665 [Lactococcus sp. dk322]
MSERINVQIFKDRHQDLYAYLEQSDLKPLTALVNLLEENKQLKFLLNDRKTTLNEYSKFMMKELVPLRLAIREIEKDSWMMKQLKNSEINDILIFNEPRYETLWSTQKVKAEFYSLLETQWEDYLNELNIRNKEREGKILRHREDELNSKEV